MLAILFLLPLPTAFGEEPEQNNLIFISESYSDNFVVNTYCPKTIKTVKKVKKVIPRVVNQTGFSYGQCTFFVASQRDIPWSGHAKSWLTQARAFGFVISEAPQVGAIIVTSESYFGHVGLVKEVYEDTILISEMNYIGWGKISTRVLNINSYFIKGYIL